MLYGNDWGGNGLGRNDWKKWPRGETFQVGNARGDSYNHHTEVVKISKEGTNLCIHLAVTSGTRLTQSTTSYFPEAFQIRFVYD